MKHLKEYIPLFKVFTTNAKSELVLCNKVQQGFSLNILIFSLNFI